MNSLKNPRLVLALLILLVSGGCMEKELPTTPSSFDVTLEKVGATKVKYTITPSNQEAYYFFCIVSPGQPEFYHSAEEAVEMCISQKELEYQAFIQRGESMGSFADFCFYKGTRTHLGKYLPADVDNQLIVAQMDPDTHELIGDPVAVTFHTRPLHTLPDLEFSVEIKDNMLVVTPTVMDVPYVWDYISTKKLYDDYGLSYIFLYELMVMYEEYNFTSYLSATGVSTWDLNRSVDPLSEGEEYTLVMAGYEDGEFTSFFEEARFIFHKNGSQLLPD